MPESGLDCLIHAIFARQLSYLWALICVNVDDRIVNPSLERSERDIFIENLLVQILFIIEMILADRPCAMGL
jgi:hypothetical protein